MAELSHNDNPTDVDGFGQQDFIKNIANVIKYSKPPKGIAINGYWGTGKTSSLKQLKKELSSKEIVPVWFEAWRYQHEATPVVALLHEIRSTFSNWNKVTGKIKKLSAITIQGILGAFDETIKAASGSVIAPKLSDLPKIGENYEKENYLTRLPTADINHLLEEAIDLALGNSTKQATKNKLVIFIDDLDRCNPETALKLLEGIKVYLNLNNCVIVFAIDQRQIEHALNKALNLKDDSDSHQAREYLEKICQDIYHLPLPDVQAKANYLDELLKTLDLGGNHDDVNQKATQALQHRSDIKLVVESFDCLPANPRKIKALANRLSVMLRGSVNLNSTRSILKHPNIKFGYALLVASAIIYTFHRELNEQLNKNPKFIDDVVKFAKNFENLSKDLKIPMKGIQPSYDGEKVLPTNPSDSNVFRLHELLMALDTLGEEDIKPFLGV